MARITIHREGKSVTVSGSEVHISEPSLPGVFAAHASGRPASVEKVPFVIDSAAHDASAEDAEGPGRPTSNPKTERCDVRLSPSDKKKFLALGGSSWLRKMLRRHGG